ncbi:MAG TPA: hypothetical protein VJ785_04600 [Anaerolineales bacterium]|nr:hypothetical protein [Anaerolineales bacterium]
MIELDFEDFHDQKYEETGYALYVMKNGLGDVLYVGVSTRSIWDRWFGWNGHLLWVKNVVEGNSSIGQKIVDHLPDSLKWKMQLWTPEECATFCIDLIPSDMQNPSLSFLEAFMIQKLSPILNVNYNSKPGKDTTSKSRKEFEREKRFDNLYKDIFDKK